MKEKIIEYLKLVRLPGWGAYSITAVFGALSVGEFSYQKLGLLLLIGIFAAIYGFVLNDYADIKTDKLSNELSERPLVKGTIPARNALILAILPVFLTYGLILYSMDKGIFLPYIEPLLILAIAALLTAIYNFYSKKFVGSDILVALAVTLYCLFGAMLVSRNITNLTLIIMIVTFIQVFYMNSIIGGLKDADHDYKLGGKNIALKLGVKADKKITIPLSFKLLAMTLRFSSAFFLFLPIFYFKDFPFYIWQPILMFLMLFGVIFATFKMLNIKVFDRDKLRRLFSIQEFLRYSVVPVMLIGFTGYPIGLFLIFFPFVWFAVLNKLMYGKSMQPKTL